MSRLTEMGQAAKEAAVVLARLSSNEKNNALKASADALEKNINEVLEANKKDVEAAVANGIKGAFIDRLTLTEKELKKWLTDSEALRLSMTLSEKSFI